MNINIFLLNFHPASCCTHPYTSDASRRGRRSRQTWTLRGSRRSACNTRLDLVRSYSSSSYLKLFLQHFAKRCCLLCTHSLLHNTRQSMHIHISPANHPLLPQADSASCQSSFSASCAKSCHLKAARKAVRLALHVERLTGLVSSFGCSSTLTGPEPPAKVS